MYTYTQQFVPIGSARCNNYILNYRSLCLETMQVVRQALLVTIMTIIAMNL